VIKTECVADFMRNCLLKNSNVSDIVVNLCRCMIQALCSWRLTRDGIKT
jgi:hypothetical protein